MPPSFDAFRQLKDVLLASRESVLFSSLRLDVAVIEEPLSLRSLLRSFLRLIEEE